MKKLDNFCDFCKRHVDNEDNGTIYFKAEHFIQIRIFDKSLASDVCICNKCEQLLIARWCQ